MSKRPRGKRSALPALLAHKAQGHVLHVTMVTIVLKDQLRRRSVMQAHTVLRDLALVLSALQALFVNREQQLRLNVSQALTVRQEPQSAFSAQKVIIAVDSLLNPRFVQQELTQRRGLQDAISVKLVSSVSLVLLRQPHARKALTVMLVVVRAQLAQLATIVWQRRQILPSVQLAATA